MKKFLSILIFFVVSVISSVSLIGFATTVEKSFQNQNTEFLPWVPKKTDPNVAEDLFADQNDATWWLLISIKLVINRVLWLLALIALIVLIYTWVMMLINARDSKKIEEWYGVVRNVAIALVFIWVSWLVVSFIFWAIGVFTTP